MPLISIVVPVLNEEESIPVFLNRLRSVMPKQVEYEIVFVNDGSTDGTQNLLEHASQDNSFVHFVEFSKNFGKEIALTAGMDAAVGEAVIVMDVDNQDPVDILPEMIDLWQKGAEVVVALRKDRNSDSVWKRKSAGGFYRVFNLLTDDTKLPNGVGDFRLMDRSVVDSVLAFSERARFMKGILTWVGYRVEYVEFVRTPREIGTTKIGNLRLLSLAMNGVFNFSTKPLRVWTYIGLLSLFLSAIIGIRILWVNIAYQATPPGLVTLVFLFFMFFGVQFMGFGLMGEYLGRTYVEAKGRPLYIVRRTSTNLPKGPRRILRD